MEACTRAGVLVVNQAGGNAEAVAEHALALMLVYLLALLLISFEAFNRGIIFQILYPVLALLLTSSTTARSVGRNSWACIIEATGT